MYNTKWVPIIDNEYMSAVYRRKIEDIKLSIDKNINKSTTPSLLTGRLSASIFYAYYSKYSTNTKYLKRAVKIALDAIKFINTTKNIRVSSDFCSGLCGIAWGIRHLTSNNFIKDDTSKLVEEFSKYILMDGENVLNNNNYEFLYGITGHINALIEGVQDPTAKKIILIFLEKLHSKRTKVNKRKIAWEFKLNANTNQLGYNFGMAHGMAGILMILNKCYSSNLLSTKLKRMLIELSEFIFDNNIFKNYNVFFPNWIFKDCKVVPSTRLAWCYGDLSIAYSLLITAINLGNTKWEKMVINMLDEIVQREAKFVDDAGICHGSIGIAHIYNRLFQLTNNNIFKENSIYWLNKTIEKSIFDDGYAGYKTKLRNTYLPSLDLISGVSGIGLCMMSMISDIEPKWDSCLLLS